MFLFSLKNRLIFLLIILFVFVNVRLVWASSSSCAAIGLLSPSRAIKCMLEDYGINEEMVKENIKYLDVSNLKKLQPQVTVTFSSTSPKPGEELTANALPLNFSNQPASLYFTWYLQPEICREENLDKEVNGTSNRVRCNLNKDYDSDGKDIVDIEDFKIKAMRIYASNDFEFAAADYSQSDEKSAYKALAGGEDQRGKNNYCYFHDVKLGKQYLFRECFHLFPDAPGYETGGGDEEFNKGEERFWHTNPDDPDTAETGHPDEANVAGLGAQNFTWIYQSGDRLGVVVEGISFDSTLYKDSSYKIMWAVPNNTCGIMEEYLDESEESEDDYTSEVSPATWPDCPDGCTFTRTTEKRKTLEEGQSDISSYPVKSYRLFTKTETITLASRRKVTGGGELTGGDGTIEVGTETAEYSPPETADCNAIDTASLVSGGFFTQAEVDSDVKYQVALETNNSCCSSEFVDEDDVPLCSITDTAVKITEEMTDLNTESEDSLFNMTEDDFNECLLEENLLSITEGGGKNEKIEMSLSFSPQNPVNDTSTEGDNADWINVVSTIENSTKNESLHYIWNVYAGQTADIDGEWGEPLLKSQLIGVEQTVGAGIPNLKFKANFSNAPKYLKVKLNVSEKVGSTQEEGTRKGHAEVIIPLSSFNNKFSAFNTLVNDSLVLSADTSTEICKINAGSNGQPVDAAICQVAPDEIIAVKANIVPETGETLETFDFLWTLNNQNLSYKYAPTYQNSNFKPGNLIFFPVLYPKSTTLNLNLVATSQVSGRKISLNKTFFVSEPSFKISSVDESTAVPKTLGHYIDLEGKEWPDYSQTEFSALKDSTVKLSVEQFASAPFPAKEDLSLEWYWNDTQLKETERTLSFKATSDIADSFSLSAKGIYAQDINTRKALNKYWNVSINEFYEKLLSEKIDFSVVDSLGENNIAQSGRQKILASFISSVPAYFAFLFRIVMTTFVLVSATWILFALFPQTEKNE